MNDYNPETGMRNDGQILVPSFYNNDDRQGIGGAVSESDVSYLLLMWSFANYNLFYFVDLCEI